jgi:hypothetical protein
MARKAELSLESVYVTVEGDARRATVSLRKLAVFEVLPRRQSRVGEKSQSKLPRSCCTPHKRRFLLTHCDVLTYAARFSNRLDISLSLPVQRSHVPMITTAVSTTVTTK